MSRTDSKSVHSRIALNHLLDDDRTIYYGRADDLQPPELWKDISHVHHIIKGRSEKDDNWSMKDNPIHLFEILSFECNAGCMLWNDVGEIELAMFAGLRDVIYTFSKFIATDPRLLVGIGDVSEESERDYRTFSEPIGFQNITRAFNGKIEFYPNGSNQQSLSSLQPKEKLRLAGSEVIRLSSELFVWFHELLHVWRRHIEILRSVGYQKLSMNELGADQVDDSNNLIQRYLEHDADRMSLLNLVENIRQETGLYYNLVRLAGLENGYRMLFYSVFCTLTSLMISQVVSQSFISQTHPPIINRVCYLIDFIQTYYKDNQEVRNGLDQAITDWKVTYEVLGWKNYISSNVQIVSISKSQMDEYCDQVNALLAKIEKVI